MKAMRFGSVSALFLLSLAAPQPATAQTAGPSASGSYRFILEDEALKYVEFVASTDERGTTTGRMSFLDQSRIPDTDDPEDPKQGDAPPELFITADFHQLTVEKNRALMSGRVVDSSHRSYIGKWVQLAVEDNGEGLRVPDQLVWRLCTPRPGGWVPSDAERRFDDGAYLRWWATDAERKDDVGVPSQNLLSEDTGCFVYPLWSYAFADVLKWEGDIVVQP